MDSLHSMRNKIGNIDIHYYTGGQGQPLMIIHGGASSARGWLEKASRLSRNYTVYVPDMPGLGHSQPQPPPQSFNTLRARMLPHKREIAEVPPLWYTNLEFQFRL